MDYTKFKTMRYNTEYTFENSFKIKNSLGEEEELKEKSIFVRGETSNYYLCSIDNDTIPTMLSKRALNETFYDQNEYYDLIGTGFLYNNFNGYTGDWELDKEKFLKFCKFRQDNQLTV